MYIQYGITRKIYIRNRLLCHSLTVAAAHENMVGIVTQFDIFDSLVESFDYVKLISVVWLFSYIQDLSNQVYPLVPVPKNSSVSSYSYLASQNSSNSVPMNQQRSHMSYSYVEQPQSNQIDRPNAWDSQNMKNNPEAKPGTGTNLQSK